jgi:hypothetical protein
MATSINAILFMRSNKMHSTNCDYGETSEVILHRQRFNPFDPVAPYSGSYIPGAPALVPVFRAYGKLE